MKIQHLRTLFAVIFLSLVVQLASASAQPVSIDRGNGQGFVFQHRGNCYLMLPAHVHGRRMRITFSTSAPITSGDAIIFQTFAPSLDLSLAYVQTKLDDRCKSRWDDLSRNIQPFLSGATRATLVRVDPAGNEQRDGMTITSSDAFTINASVAGAASADEVYQGTSGAILLIGDTIVGMAVQSPDPHQAVFVRVDEIVARLSRLLDARQPAQTQPPNDPELTAGGLCGASTIKIAAVQCSTEADIAEHGCSNLAAGGGPVSFPAGSRNVCIEVDFAGKNAIPLKQVVLGTSLDDSSYAAPQTVLMEVDSSNAAPHWRRFGQADMSPVGTFDFPNAAAPYARRLKLTFLSTWNDKFPMRLDCIALN